MKKVIVIGNGMVGYKFCEKLVAHPLRDQFELVVFGEEFRPAYDRVHLSEYFTLDSADKLLLASRDWYAENNITLRTGEMITSIETETKRVFTHKHDYFEYDYL